MTDLLTIPAAPLHPSWECQLSPVEVSNFKCKLVRSTQRSRLTKYLLFMPNLSWLGKITLGNQLAGKSKIAPRQLKMWKTYAGSGWIKRYIFSPGNRTVIFFMDISRSKQVCVKITPASCRNDAQLTPFASKNGNLFRCVSKTSCCECILKERYTQ